MCADASAKVRIGAMDALAAYGEDANPACVPFVAANVGHADWQVRVAACQVLRRVGDFQCVDALVARMQTEAGRVGEEVLRTLRAVTGEDLGEKPGNWQKWWDREGARVKEHRGFDKKLSPDAKANERYAKPEVPPPAYYGVDLFSQRIGFVIDVSRSTNRRFVVGPVARALLHAAYPDATISEICRGEAAASIQALDPRAFFQVIAFGSEVRRWENAMAPATETNKRSATTFANALQPAGETNFYGALCAALDLDAGALASPDFRNTPDTMVFLTDGTPTVGEITDPDTLLEWYTELNRYCRVRTHTIAFGRLEVDGELLRKLSGRNDGEFRQVFEEN
jgi:hypothetical protein